VSAQLWTDGLGDSNLGQEKAMEKIFGVIMLAVLIVVAILGYHYN
jgi:hypothetical protein